MSVHIYAKLRVELLVDLNTVGQIGVELNNGSHAVCHSAEIRNERRIRKAVCLRNDHLRCIILCL